MLQNDSYLDSEEQRGGGEKAERRPERGRGMQSIAVLRACMVCWSRQQGRDPSSTMKARSSQGTKHVCSVRAGARVAVTQRCAEWSGRNAIKSATP